ncbi:MAG: class I SAM-dependent methyltransferase [Methanothrix sp.]|nr:class I SAM-dependent methyltransferase [Methanothrix sp.]MCX8207292.1 class I SAM-dependent methyltransferase [Methanothrix sp.]
MLINKMLNLEEDECVFLAEESLEDLIWLPVTRNIVTEADDFNRAIAVNDRTLALYSEPQDLWILMTDLYSEIRPVSDLIKRMDCERVGVDENDLLQAIVECLSVSLMEGVLCDSCIESGAVHHPEDRTSRLESMLRELLDDVLYDGSSVLEVGCGSGTGTRVLRMLGAEPWAMDIDRCEVCQGLRAGALDPMRTFVLDARLLPRFFSTESFDAVMGFMVGLIDNSNWHIWKEIISKSSSLARNTVLYTVYSRREAEMIADLLGTLGWEGRLIDNSNSIAVYDQWVYLGWKDGS